MCKSNLAMNVSDFETSQLKTDFYINALFFFTHNSIII